MHIESALRKAWAAYFDARAAKSEKNAALHPRHRQSWLDKAAGERECAVVMRSEKTLEELRAALAEDA